jgi:hypothetical protein
MSWNNRYVEIPFPTEDKPMIEQERIKNLAKILHVSESLARTIDPASVALNEAAERIQKQSGVSFGEALTQACSLPEFAESREVPKAKTKYFAEHPEISRVGVEPYSVLLDVKARHIADDRKLEYGEALIIARAEFAEGGGLTPAEVAEIFGPSISDVSSPQAQEAIDRIMAQYRITGGISRETATHLYLLGQ